jgi:transcriptional pleiotropic regulator of transition state genes
MATKKRRNEPRSVDGVGRLVIPVDMRTRLGLTEGSEVDFQLDGQRIIIQKYNPGCIFCDSTEECFVYSGKRICRHCLDEIRQMG